MGPPCSDLEGRCGRAYVSVFSFAWTRAKPASREPRNGQDESHKTFLLARRCDWHDANAPRPRLGAGLCPADSRETASYHPPPRLVFYQGLKRRKVVPSNVIAQTGDASSPLLRILAGSRSC